MLSSRFPIPQGTLDMLVLQILSLGADFATCEALQASSSRWPRNSSEAFTAFGETGGPLALLRLDPRLATTSCFLDYLRRQFVKPSPAISAQLRTTLAGC
jgi:hypothetical protein